MYELVFKDKSAGFGSFNLGLLLGVSVFSFTYGLTGPSCDYGSYSDAGKTCCLCPKGYYVEKPCTSKDPWPQCNVCPTGAYTSEANSFESCEPCQVCRSKVNNLEVEKPCTSTSNAVCRCKSGHFCVAEECKACQPCDECKWGEKEPCTSKNDTVCKEMPVAGIAVGVVLPVVIIAGLIAFLLWQRKKLCFAEKKKGDGGPQEFEPLQPTVNLKGIDLMPHVDDIITHLSWNDMVKVAYKTGMTKVEMERHQTNHPNNSEEQTRSLLCQWIETQGLPNACETFSKTLRECKLARTADEIELLISKKTKCIADV